MTAGVTVILPVRPWGLSESKLAVNEHSRIALARAFSLDVLDVAVSAASVGLVIVVTSEPELRSIAAAKGARVVEDRPLLSADPLNTAIKLGTRWAEIYQPGSPAIVIPADLPSLTRVVLDQAIEVSVTRERAFIPDFCGCGTTLLAARQPDLLIPAFGRESARRHIALGYEPVTNIDVRIRRDVDTAENLREARHLGVGLYTQAAIASIGGPIRG